MWFCAHAIFYFQLLEGDQDSYLVHENVYLVQAGDPAAARVRAEAIARANEDTSEDGHLEVNERKAAYLFAGLRKLIEVEPHRDVVGPSGLTGLEVTYSVLEVDTLEEVRALARGDMVDVLYRE